MVTFNSNFCNAFFTIFFQSDLFVFLTVCHPPFTPLGESCIMVDLEARLTWHEARTYCNKFESDLVKIKDANNFAELIGFVKKSSELPIDYY